MKIQVPQFDGNKRLNDRKEIDVNFPICIKQTRLSNNENTYLTYLSENRQISMIVRQGSLSRIDISTFEIDASNDLGAIYQANGFDNTVNKAVEVGYFKRLLEMEKCKIIELISLV